MKLVIPMGGNGKRFVEGGYIVSKPFLQIGGTPMIDVVRSVFGDIGEYILIARNDHLPYLTQLNPNYRTCIFPEYKKVEGAADAVASIMPFVNPEEELIIMNSDQYILFDTAKWLKELREQNIDGSILTFKSNDPKWSYAKTENGFVTEVAEKVVISEEATVGIYYFRQSKLFTEAFNSMKTKNIRTNGEFYVCPVYNEICRDHRITVSEVDKMFGLGTPSDYEINAPLIGKPKI